MKVSELTKLHHLKVSDFTVVRPVVSALCRYEVKNCYVGVEGVVKFFRCRSQKFFGD